MFSLNLENKLPCFTQSRFYLGRLIDIEKDENNQPINYLIKTKLALRPKFGKILSVASAQIIKITTTEIVVNDSLIQEPAVETSASVA